MLLSCRSESHCDFLCWLFKSSRNKESCKRLFFSSLFFNEKKRVILFKLCKKNGISWLFVVILSLKQKLSSSFSSLACFFLGRVLVDNKFIREENALRVFNECFLMRIEFAAFSIRISIQFQRRAAAKLMSRRFFELRSKVIRGRNGIFHIGDKRGTEKERSFRET